MGLPDDYFTVPDCEVWPEHWPALKMFMIASDQWRIAGERYVGLDLNVLLQLLRLYNVKHKRQVVEDVQVIARRAVELLNSKGKG